MRTPTIIILAGLLLAAGSAPAMEAKSGYEFLRQATREMQDDDFANPGMAAVDAGRKLYNTPGNSGKTCASCHGEDGSGLNPKRLASYPRYNAEEKQPWTLQAQINWCWEEYLDNVPFVYECPEVVRLETFVRSLARDEPVKVDVSGELKPFYEAGEQLYNTRFGQANLACANCHDQYAGRMLRGQMLSQGQTNGFPEYRLGSGKITGLHGRMQECMGNFRAEPFERGSPEFLNLEVFLHARGNGLPIETPAVRY